MQDRSNIRISLAYARNVQQLANTSDYFMGASQVTVCIELDELCTAVESRQSICTEV